MYKKFGYIVLLFWLSQSNSYGQKNKDTAALIQQLNTVLAFAIQPYLYYSNTTICNASPILQPQDTIQLKGEFYKVENDFYYKNNNDEYYLQDSFQIQINHEEKTILINKVEVATKVNINVLPLNSKNMQALFKQKYTLTQEVKGKDIASINIQTKQAINEGTQTTFNYGITYNTKNNLPTEMLIKTDLTQNISAEDAQSLEQDEQQKKMVKKQGDDYSIARQQTITINFSNYDISKAKAQQMPKWQSVLQFNQAANSFTALSPLAAYEITQTF
jgi:uncharacterized protein YqkB